MSRSGVGRRFSVEGQVAVATTRQARQPHVAIALRILTGRVNAVRVGDACAGPIVPPAGASVADARPQIGVVNDHSHGLEFAVESGLVRDRTGLADWTAMILVQGSAQVDAVLFCEAWQPSHNRDGVRLCELVQIAAAFRGTGEMALESSNKIDLAPFVGASLEVMDRDTRRMRGDRPFVFTNLKEGKGLKEIVQFIVDEGGL